MKNLIKIATVAFGVGITGIANAQSFNEVEVPMTAETPSFMARFNVSPETYRLKVLLARKDWEAGTTICMSLKDDKGQELFSRKFGKKEKQKIILLNMSQLDNGLYTLEMSDKNSTISKVFSKGQEIVSVKNTHALVAIK
ncbi:MAG: hypothetical protein ACK4YV_07610 [Emticicia sp.]